MRPLQDHVLRPMLTGRSHNQTRGARLPPEDSQVSPSGIGGCASDGGCCLSATYLDFRSDGRCLGFRIPELRQVRKQRRRRLAREQGHHSHRRAEAFTDVPAAPRRVGQPRQPDRDRTAGDHTPDILPINRRRPAHLRSDGPDCRRRRPARPPLRSRLRDRARAQPPRRADAAWKPNRAEPDRGSSALNKTTTWRAAISYASADPVLDHGVSRLRSNRLRSADT